jgi:hypothetical protein
MQFVRIGKDGSIEQGGPAPTWISVLSKMKSYPEFKGSSLSPGWLGFRTAHSQLRGGTLVPEHFEEVRISVRSLSIALSRRVRERKLTCNLSSPRCPRGSKRGLVSSRAMRWRVMAWTAIIGEDISQNAKNVIYSAHG